MAQPGDVKALLDKYVENRCQSRLDAKASTRIEDFSPSEGKTLEESVGGDQNTHAPVRVKWEKDAVVRDGYQENDVGEARRGFVDKIVSLKDLLPQNFNQTSLEGILEDTALFIKDLRVLLAAAGERVREYEQLERNRSRKYAKVDLQCGSSPCRDCSCQDSAVKSLLENVLPQLLRNGSKEPAHPLERLVSPPTKADRDDLKRFLASYQVGDKRQHHQY